jgi:hypothetical protein
MGKASPTASPSPLHLLPFFPHYFVKQEVAMAQKEATVFVLDLGKSMGEKRHGRDETNLDWAMKYVWDKITATVCIHRSWLIECCGVGSEKLTWV